jgi:hypothetical protein
MRRKVLSSNAARFGTHPEKRNGIQVYERADIEVMRVGS